MSSHRSVVRPHSSLRLIVAAVPAMLLAACSFPQEVQGNMPDTDGVAAVQPGISNKADVTRLLGSPSSVASFDSNTWYYIGRRVQRLTLQDPDLLEQRVYVVSFDDKGTVKELATHVNDDQDVAMISRTTPAPGKELSFIEQLLGSFGRFGAADKGKKKQDQG